MLYYSTVVFSFLIALAGVVAFIYGTMALQRRFRVHNKEADLKLEAIIKKLRWRKDQEERKRSEFLVVRDYVELQNKKRAYVSEKVELQQAAQRGGRELTAN